MPRRPPLVLVVLGASCGVLALGVVAAVTHDEPGSSPNVLLIVTDDQRADEMDVMAHTLERFGDGGTTFTNAFSTTPLCCPSRASIFSGRYAHNHRVETNALDDVTRLDQTATIQQHLRDAGYQTGIAGKYFNEWDLATPPPAFDTWAITTEGYEAAAFSVDGVPTQAAVHSTDFIAEQALRMLDGFETDDDRPWFLYVAPFAPHFPYTPSPADAAADVGTFQPGPAAAETALQDKPPWVAERAGATFGRTPQDVWVAQRRTLLGVDRMVDALFERLDAAGEGNTLAVYVSDNGFLLGEHGIVEDKRMPYDESVRVPLLVRWPSSLDEGAQDSRLVANIDIAPTILDAAGIDLPRTARLDGHSLLSSSRRAELLLEFASSRESERDPGVPTWAALRTVERNYIEWYGPEGLVAWRELYDLDADPDELESLVPGTVDASDARVSALSQRLSTLRECSGDGGPLACP